MIPPLDTKTVLGQPHYRVDGVLKVTGKAIFPADKKIPGLAYAVLVTSSIGRGKITSIDYAAAKSVPGLLTILTHETVTAYDIQPVKHMMSGGYLNSSLRPLASTEIFYAGQIVALVVADNLEAANEAAQKLKIVYSDESEKGVWSLADARAQVKAVSEVKPGFKDRAVGDFKNAFENAAIKVDETYATPIQHHNPMELFTTTCQWDGPRLTVYEPTRFIVGAQHGLAAQFGMDPKNVRVIARFLGGHFGSKLGLPQYTSLVALASKRIERPVTLATSRADGFSIANHRPDSRHHICIGADTRGQLVALSHEATSSTSQFDLFAMEGVDVTSALYACPNIKTKESVARVDRNTPGPMRAPPEVPYLFALESAIDELANKLDIDPIEFRRLNDTKNDSVTGKSFTTRRLMECFDKGAKSFGWNQRSSKPGATRDGNWLIGYGCASAARPVKIGAAAMRITLSSSLQATVETAHHEIGNGIYTVLSMAAADELGIPLESVRVYLGDTSLPAAGVSGGSATSTTLVNALAQGCDELRKRLTDAANAAKTANADAVLISNSPANSETSPDAPKSRVASGSRLNKGSLEITDGRIIPLRSLIEKNFGKHIEVIVEYVPPGMPADTMQKLKQGHSNLITAPTDKLAWTFGAQFVEVRVHAETGEIHVTRMTGAFAGGRILNPLTAKSQLTGGMIWGLSSALLEASEIDKKTGLYINSNLADYLVPTFADTGDITAIFIEDIDYEVNDEGIKGLGEIGIIGVNAAIANAVFNATGKRIRSLPIKIEDAFPA